jgi:hypothetical protein
VARRARRWRGLSAERVRPPPPPQTCLRPRSRICSTCTSTRLSAGASMPRGLDRLRGRRPAPSSWCLEPPDTVAIPPTRVRIGATSGPGAFDNRPVTDGGVASPFASSFLIPRRGTQTWKLGRWLTVETSWLTHVQRARASIPSTSGCRTALSLLHRNHTRCGWPRRRAPKAAAAFSM